MSIEAKPICYSRLPLNVEGDFYAVGSKDAEGSWYGECLDCALPENEAPDLLAPMDENHTDTHFIKQPQTKREIEQAIAACKSCCVNALRYSGKDKYVLNELGHEYCDYKIDDSGNIIENIEYIYKPDQN